MTALSILPLPKVKKTDSTKSRVGEGDPSLFSAAGLELPVRLATPKSKIRHKSANMRSRRLRTQKEQLMNLGDRFQQINNLLQNTTESKIKKYRRNVNNIVPNRAIVFEGLEPGLGITNSVDKISDLEILTKEQVVSETRCLISYASRNEPHESTETLLSNDINEASEETTAPTQQTGKIWRVIAMPSMQSLSSLKHEWDNWRRHSDGAGVEQYEQGNLFDRAGLRPWGPNDRVTESAIEWWSQNVAIDDPGYIQIEVALWFRDSADQREKALEEIKQATANDDVKFLSRSTLSAVGSDVAIFEITHAELRHILNREPRGLTHCDAIQYIRPKRIAIWNSDMSIATITEDEGKPTSSASAGITHLAKPIAALIDGEADQGHVELMGRVELCARREYQWETSSPHGTAMASILLHGDLYSKRGVVGRRIVNCPVPLYREREGNVLTNPVDAKEVISDYCTYLKTRYSDDCNCESEIFMVSLSLGIKNQQSDNEQISFGFLLDALAYEYNILFLNSAGNWPEKGVRMDRFVTLQQFWDANKMDREREVLKALVNSAAERGITSPADSRNTVTVGSQFKQWVPRRRRGGGVEPFLSSDSYPNVYSAIGFGKDESIKPEILLPAGRCRVDDQVDRVLEFKANTSLNSHGLCAAEPGGPTRRCLSNGTSSATALAAYAAQKLYDRYAKSLADRGGVKVCPEFNAVAIKSLLINASSWGANCGVSGFDDTMSLNDTTQLLGYGFVDVDAILTPATNRVTMLECINLNRDHWSESYAIPIPLNSSNVFGQLNVAVTVAWMSPVNPHAPSDFVAVAVNAGFDDGHYCCLRRAPFQPPEAKAERGTVYHQRFLIQDSPRRQKVEDLVVHIKRKRSQSLNKMNVRVATAVTVGCHSDSNIYDEFDRLIAV